MSKAHDPHWRYVAFRMEGPTAPSRRSLQNAVTGRFRKLAFEEDEIPRLTRYEWPHAIVKVHHLRLEDTRAGLPRLDFAIEAAAKIPLRVETLSSGGTLKALTKRLGVLQKRG